MNKNMLDLNESILTMIHEYVVHNTNRYGKPSFEEDIHNYVFDNIIMLIYVESLWAKIKDNINFYFNTIGIRRSYPKSSIVIQIDKVEMKKKLEDLRKIPQPAQKEPEWYKFRWNMLTASSIWKALGTISSQNQLIYQKCLPLDISKYTRVNVKSTFHHGHKYEPMTTAVYEKKYNTIVSEWGCIQHQTHKFIGASPDGINIKEDNPRYGRLIEVKNIVNRNITGIPKEDYWIQTQIQMEVCDLDECDFVETRFIEYECEDDFMKDGTFEKTADDKLKGIIVNFYDGKEPKYIYSPLGLNKEEYEKWYDECMEKYETLTWVNNIYWKLDEFSCILIPRNRAWFQSVCQKFKEIWDIVLYEREHGYDHRKPKKRKAKKKNEIVVIKTEPFVTTQLV